MSALLIFQRGAVPLLAALVTAGALLAPATAQQMGKRGHNQQSSAEKKPTVSDKDYKAALERIPDPKQKYDPWGSARPGGSAAGASAPQKGAQKSN